MDSQQNMLAQLQEDDPTFDNDNYTNIDPAPTDAMEFSTDFPNDSEKHEMDKIDCDQKAKVAASMPGDTTDETHKRKRRSGATDETLYVNSTNMADVDDTKRTQHRKQNSALPDDQDQKSDPPKKKKTVTRKQPGYSMIKLEEERLRSSLDALLHKRKQREKANGGSGLTSTCSVLANNLIEFYEDMINQFDRKFGRYIS